MYRIVNLLLALCIIFISGCSSGSGLENDGVVIVPAKTDTSAQTQPAVTSAPVTADLTEGQTSATVTETGTVTETETRILETDKQENIVYWVEGGSVWHIKNSCRSLERSKNIQSGTVEEAQHAGKSRPCKICS